MKKILILAAAGILFSVTVEAKMYKNPDAGYQLNVPSKFKSSMEEGVLSVETKDDDMAMAIMVFPGNQIEEAGKALDEQIKKMIPDFAEDKNEEHEATINGMKAFTAGGKGTLEGEAVEVGLMLVVTPKNHVLMIFGIIKADASKKYEKEMERLIKSIKPLK